MIRFEITTAPEAPGGVQQTLAVDATDWIDAWRQALAAFGEAAEPRDVDCELGTGEIRLRLRVSGRWMVIRPAGDGRACDEALPPLPGPTGRRRGPEDYTVLELGAVRHLRPAARRRIGAR